MPAWRIKYIFPHDEEEKPTVRTHVVEARTEKQAHRVFHDYTALYDLGEALIRSCTKLKITKVTP